MVRGMVEQHPGWQVCGEACDGAEAVQRATELRPDVIVMDLVMPKLNGLEATRKIHELSPSARVLILTLHENPVLPKIAQDSGANGYVVKSESLDTLTRAIESVGESNRFFVAH